MPKPRGRPRGSKTEAPVSLSPLEPEEALAGLLKVRPEGEKLMSEDRMNKRECPHCQKPLNDADDNWLQAVINRAIEVGSLQQNDTPRELSCGHKASAEAADFPPHSSGFWLVPR